jgi:hypothetical protein
VPPKACSENGLLNAREQCNKWSCVPQKRQCTCVAEKLIQNIKFSEPGSCLLLKSMKDQRDKALAWVAGYTVTGVAIVIAAVVPGTTALALLTLEVAGSPKLDREEC